MIMVREIVAATAAVAQLGVADLIGRERPQHITRPRHRAMFLARRLRPDLSYPGIGLIIGGRDHTTVLHGERRVEARLAQGDNQERDALCATLIRLGLGDDLDAVLLAAREGRLALTRAALERRHVELQSELARVERQLAALPLDTAQ